MPSAMEFATTPLALASLIAILIIGLLKILARGKNNALNRLITHYGFGLVLFFGLLGNVIFVYESYQSSETLIIGTVVDENGNYLPRVMIDTGGHARGMSSDTGEFILAVPKSRVQSEYKVSASLQGYESNIQTVTDKSRIFMRFILAKKIFNPNKSLAIGDHRVIISHYIGLPDVVIQFKFSNPTNKQIQFKNIGMEITNSEGNSRRLIQTAIANDINAPNMPILNNIIVEPNNTLEFYFRFTQYDTATQNLMARIQPSILSTPTFKAYGPRSGANYLTEEDSQTVKALMNNSWFWTSGTSKIKLTASVKGFPVEVERHIKLSSQQIDSMKRISEHYQDGFGVIYEISKMPIGNAVPALEIISLPSTKI